MVQMDYVQADGHCGGCSAPESPEGLAQLSEQSWMGKPCAGC